MSFTCLFFFGYLFTSLLPFFSLPPSLPTHKMIRRLHQILLANSESDVEIEYEARFQNVSHTFFDELLQSLDRYEGWESTREYTAQDVFHEGCRYRRRSDGKHAAIVKDNVVKKNYPILVPEELDWFPSQLRVSICKEKTLTPPKKVVTPHYTREKLVREFQKGHYLYVLSIVKSGKDFSKQNTTSFEIEVELIEPLQYIRKNGVEYVQKSVQLKLQNLLQNKAIVELDSDPFSIGAE